MSQAGELRRASRVAVGAVACLALILVGGASAKSHHGVHAAFVHLRSNIRNAHGLSKKTRAKFIAKAALAEKRDRRQHRPCDAMALLEDLRSAISRSAAPHVGGGTAVEVGRRQNGRW